MKSKSKPISSLIALTLLLEASTTLGPREASAMGKKRQQETEAAEKAKKEQEERALALQAQIDSFTQMIREQHAQINRLRERLKLEPMSEPNLAPVEGETHPTLSRLMGLMREQNEEIVRLEKLMDEYTGRLESTEKQRRESAEKAAARVRELLENPNMSSDPAHWVEQRCYGLLDAMESVPALADGRIRWSTKCLNKRFLKKEADYNNTLAETGRGDLNLDIESNVAQNSLKLIMSANRNFSAGRWWYPSYGKTIGSQMSNPEFIIAPTNADEDCGNSIQVSAPTESEPGGKPIGIIKKDILDTYHLAAMCVTGCYTPDQKILFDEGYQTIGSAYRSQKMQIQTLTADSSLEEPRFETHEIQAYTVDVSDALQEVLDIETVGGKKITVTRNHPLLDPVGQMRRAETFIVGESLVSTDGSIDPIRLISGRSYYGKVYNVRIQGQDLKNQIIAAQGVLTGSVHFQNEGVKDLNRQIFRNQIPDYTF